MPKFRKEIYGMIKKYMAVGALLVPAVLICLPMFLILTGSVMDSLEMKQYLLPVFGDGEGYIRWKLMPDYPTFEHYGRLLFMTPSFFVLFWNSVKMVVCILAGQLLVGVPAAWAFAAYSVRGSRALFALYVVLMLLPFQVTMLSSYLVLDRLGMMNTHAAIILPAVFSTLPIFLTYGGFRAIPPQLFEAARIDGAGELRIFGVLESDGTAAGVSGRESAVALVIVSAGNFMAAGGLCALRLVCNPDSGGFCVCAGAGLSGAGDRLFRLKRIKQEELLKTSRHWTGRQEVLSLAWENV